MNAVVPGISVSHWYHTYDFPNFRTKGEANSPTKWHLLERHLPSLVAQTLVDIGCNQGYFSLRAAMAGAIVTGIDVNPREIEVATAIRNSFLRDVQARFINLDLSRLGELGVYDFSFCFSVVHHVPLLATIHRIAQATRKTAFIEALVDMSLPSDRPLFSLSDNPHVEEVLPSPSAFEAILKRHFGTVTILNPGEARLLAKCDK